MPSHQDNVKSIEYNTVYKELKTILKHQREWQVASEVLFKNGILSYGESWEQYFKRNELLDYLDNENMMPTAVMAQVEKANNAIAEHYSQRRHLICRGLLLVCLLAVCCSAGPIGIGVSLGIAALSLVAFAASLACKSSPIKQEPRPCSLNKPTVHPLFSFLSKKEPKILMDNIEVGLFEPRDQPAMI